MGAPERIRVGKLGSLLRGLFDHEWDTGHLAVKAGKVRARRSQVATALSATGLASRDPILARLLERY